jgi:ubiquinone/menaquinone biosynthesis C-methylase UbiE
MGQSISFDRAASFYDKTRAISPEVFDDVMKSLLSGLEERGPTLEIGVGTGRFAIPLMKAGVDVTGLDLSAAMLKQLIANSNGELPAKLVRGDATRLPFLDDAFGAALGFWVLHLIPDWTKAVDELVRVVRPGGALVFETGGWDAALRLDSMFCVFAGVEPKHRGLNDVVDLDAHLASHGFARRDLGEWTDPTKGSIEQIIAHYEAGTYSFTWGVDEAKRLEAGAKLREWAAAEHGSLEEVRTFAWKFRPRLYERSSL